MTFDTVIRNGRWFDGTGSPHEHVMVVGHTVVVNRPNAATA